MRLFQGMTIFGRTNSRTRWLIAAWHSPHSLTWRWLLDFQWEPGCFRPLWWGRISTNIGGQGFITVPLLGRICWATQQPMWYRDMYRRMRDEQNQRDGLLWLRDKHPHKIHPTPEPPPLPTIGGPRTIQ